MDDMCSGQYVHMVKLNPLILFAILLWALGLQRSYHTALGPAECPGALPRREYTSKTRRDGSGSWRSVPMRNDYSLHRND